MEEYSGKLGWWFETGTEGVVWIFEIDGREELGYDSFKTIKEGDHLIVYEADDSIIFDGRIVCDDKVGWKEYSLNPGHGQPCVFNSLWIHWTQKGWQPDDWALLFMRHDLKVKEDDLRWGAPQLRAKLRRSKIVTK